MIIREARVEEAEAICFLLRRSITELCVRDHGGDKDILARWVDTKTPALLQEWIQDPQSSFLVAENNHQILALGSVMDSGQITLNYVAPEARFQGISRAMVKALEKRAQERGAREIHLMSTQTARQFYLAQGYRESAPEKGFFGPIVYPMHKTLG